VIGSLRAGGAGKTAVTLELARQLGGSGLRVGVLAYRLQASGEGRKSPVATEVFPDTDWRTCSDEAVLLARESGARVFVTRNRESAWEALGRAGGFDILLSDDGIMDARLEGAFRVLLKEAGDNPGWMSLLPAGPYHLTVSALARADVVMRADREFKRRPLLPPEWEPEKAYWALCGLGNPAAFMRALRKAGVRVAGFSAGPDHGLPDLARARREAARAGVDRFLCSEKDRIKLENHPDRPAGMLGVGEAVSLAPEIMAAAQRLVPSSLPTS
jgi:tetraacyldisaccharide-1-P 4'-kinase